jgi:4'-phosphopantetheinyl transferase EntD
VSTLIGELLPTYVAYAERESNDSSASLLPGEEAGLGHTVESRVREFATARACARRALKQLGAPTVAVPRGLNREPIWPQGYVGSITHCEGYRGAAVARRQDTFGIGIDAEPHQPLPLEILSLVTIAAERTWLSRVGEDFHWDRLIFSAKESVYKAWFPLTRSWLDFGDVCITVDIAAGGFRAELLRDSAKLGGRTLDNFSGRFMFTQRHILTAVVVTR